MILLGSDFYVIGGVLLCVAISKRMEAERICNAAPFTPLLV
jgi:hypothetical protein